MPGFIQIIEFTTSQIDAVKKLGDEVRSAAGGTVKRVAITADRDHPGRYFNIVEFDSYESAMENSNRPETAEFSRKMMELTDGPPTFYNLDVSEVWEP